MTENLSEIRKEIKRIEKLLEDLHSTKEHGGAEELLKELDKLNYHYFKAFMRQMRDLNGDGDGI